MVGSFLNNGAVTLMAFVVFALVVLTPQQPCLKESYQTMVQVHGQHYEGYANTYRYGDYREERMVTRVRTPITHVYPHLRYQPFAHERNAHNHLYPLHYPYRAWEITR